MERHISIGFWWQYLLFLAIKLFFNSLNTATFSKPLDAMPYHMDEFVTPRISTVHWLRKTEIGSKQKTLCDTMSDFVLHATVDSCYHGVQSIFKAQMKVQPSNLSFLTFKSHLPNVEVRKTSILLHSGLMLSLEVLQLFLRYYGNNSCHWLTLTTSARWGKKFLTVAFDFLWRSILAQKVLLLALMLLSISKGTAHLGLYLRFHQIF